MGKKLKILLTGVSGQVGWELQRALMSVGEIIPADRKTCDLADPDSIRRFIREVQPHAIVNPAAYTAVDKAESEPELAMAINGIAPGIMAEEAKKFGAVMIHYSTDYVFDGKQTRPYREEDSTNPLGVYGRTKLAGEVAVRSAGIPHLILRTSWVYSRTGRNFLLSMLRLSRERKELRVVDDQVGAPTWSRLIAEVTAQILAKGGNNWGAFFGENSGTYHLSCNGKTSWYGFTKAILETDPQRSQQIVERLIAIATSEYPTPAQRPAYSLLNCSKLAETFQLVLPKWEQALQLAISE